MAKLYATLGPACNQTDVLAQMLHYGLDGMRLNLSHTSLKESTQLLSTFRSACRTVGQQADLMIDLQGPEQRIDGIPEPYTVTSGDQLVIQPSVNCKALPAFHVSPGLAAALRTGDHLLSALRSFAIAHPGQTLILRLMMGFWRRSFGAECLKTASPSR